MANGESYKGWTLQKAWDKCVDPGLIDRIHETTQAWRRLGAPRMFVYGRDSPGWRARQAKAAAHSKALGFFYRLLIDSRLVALGRRESPLAELRLINASAWNHLRIKNWKASVAVEQSKAATKIFEITIYPVVEAPDALEHLSGRTLVEVCGDWVLNDPEVAAARERAIKAGGQPVEAGFGMGGYDAIHRVACPDPDDSDSPIGILNEPTAATKLADEADKIVASRLCRLLGYLAESDLTAQGLSAAGIVTDVPRAFWRRPGTYVDLKTGDLLERDPNARDETSAFLPPLFRALALRRSVTANGRQDRHEDPQELSKAELRVSTIAAAKTECINWLVAEMTKSPNTKPKPKTMWWHEARDRWPSNLSRRAFDGAWDSARATTGANAWSSAGAPRKSKKSNHHTT